MSQAPLSRRTALYIRARNPAAFRSNQWAKVVGVQYLTPPGGSARCVYVVEFVDGQTDSWPVYDVGHEYEFSHTAS